MLKSLIQIALLCFILSACVQKTDSSLSISPENYPQFTFLINNGKVATNSHWVELDIQTSRDDIAEVLVSRGNSCDEANFPWEPYSKKIGFPIEPKDGEKLISIKLKTRYGFPSPCVTQKIILDQVVPGAIKINPLNPQVYMENQNINITVNFSEDVYVTQNPRLKLTIGSNVRYADYLSGSGTKELTFRYSVKFEDEDYDGVDLSNRIDMATGQIVDVAGNAPVDYLFEESASASDLKVNALDCPAEFIPISAIQNYSRSPFCVAKYEMKIQGESNGIQTYRETFAPESRASGTPWVNLNRDQAINECQSLGSQYDLISNNQWQTIAQNIELVGWNWGSGVVGSSEGLSRGHSDNSPSFALAADNEIMNACAFTGQTCDLQVWNEQRRVFVTKSGYYLWDFAGNVAEFIKEGSTTSFGGSTPVSTLQNESHPTSGLVGSQEGTGKFHFGSSGNYSHLASSPFAGLGRVTLESPLGAIFRGGGFGDTFNAGVFSAVLNVRSSESFSNVGFRCIMQPDIQRPHVELVSGSGDNMDVLGPGNPAYGSPVVFTYKNTGNLNSDKMVATLSDVANFEVTSDSCTGKILAPQATCSVTVRAKATTNGSLSSNLILSW